MFCPQFALLWGAVPVDGAPALAQVEGVPKWSSGPSGQGGLWARAATFSLSAAQKTCDSSLLSQRQHNACTAKIAPGEPPVGAIAR